MSLSNSPRAGSTNNNNASFSPFSSSRPPVVVTTTAPNSHVVHSPSGTFSVASFAVSTTSSAYRHYSSGAFPPQTPPPSLPQTKLSVDSNHKPRTRGSVGLLVVGFTGPSSTALLAGILANRMELQWKGPRGEPRRANYNACTTQEQPCNQAGFANSIKGLANVSMAAIGGWDIVPTRLGDALLEAQVLDYDLVRQVKEEMNKIKVFRGYHDNDQKYTHVLSPKEAPTAWEALKCLRADIRYFKWRNGVVGHTTVLWNATDEAPVAFLSRIETARDLLHVMENDQDYNVPPSLVYATAALLEGCSFCNARRNWNLASCPGLVDLAQSQVGVYCLGSDFRVPSDFLQHSIQETLQSVVGMPTTVHTTSIMEPTPNNTTNPVTTSLALTIVSDDNDLQKNDSDTQQLFKKGTNVSLKRNLVEYTSVGFLGQEHTLVAYTTQACHAVLMAPLLMDVAVWCDYFSNRSWPFEKVSRALAYLFSQPNANHDVSIQELQTQATAACQGNATNSQVKKKKKRVRIRPEEKTTEWAIPHNAQIVCAGLACVDMQLHQATGGNGGESIETFTGVKSIAGGSVSMACKTLARLVHGAPLGDDYMQVTPPVVHAVVPLCKIGHDDSGHKLLHLLEECGEACRNVETKHMKRAREHDLEARTALAVLPIYRDGRRGCYFDAASNETFSESAMMDFIHGLVPSNKPIMNVSSNDENANDDYVYMERSETTLVYGAFLFGYPHLLPQMQGMALANILREARTVMEEGGVVALDLNGVPEETLQLHDGYESGTLRTLEGLQQDAVIGPALQHVDILHMNQDELVLLTGCELGGSLLEDEFAIASAVNLFLQCGVAIVAVTRGKIGSFVCCNKEERFRKSPLLPASWTDCTANIAAVELPRDTVINTNGAGDSFTAGLLVASMLRHTGMSVPVRKDNEDDNDNDGADNMSSEGENSLHLEDLAPQSPPTPRISSPTKQQNKLSPYTLYMRENYVTLKQQLHDDKKAIFSKCHEMWENETEEVKAMYERRSVEEIEEQNEASVRLDNDLEALDSTPRNESPDRSFSTNGEHEAKIRSLYMTNRALNLESAVQFASLVAAHHIDLSTRDLSHIDMSRLLERAMIFPHGLEEI